MVVTSAPIAFGSYRLLERIAVGGMAEIFRAVKPGLEGFEKTLVIKRIRPHLSNETSFVNMFLHEAKLAAQLQHPNIVQIFELGKIDGSYFIAMEYVSGRDMSRVIPKAEGLGIPFPMEYAIFIACGVLEGLSYAHGKTDDFGAPLNVVHRDITPENIMVGWNGNVKILDFGIAKATTQTDPTKAGEIKGKLAYMSPEQGLGKTLDERSDLFALGVVLYEWVTGYRLFTGENEMAVLKSIIDGRIYPPSYFREDIPVRVEEILMKALAKDRDERYRNARDFQLDLQQWLASADFTPTSLHLSNFMKQIFDDELGEERRLLAEAARERKRRTPPPPPTQNGGLQDAAAEEVHELVVVRKAGDTGPSALTREDGERAVSVRVDRKEWERLVAAAERSGTTPEELLRDVVRTTLRYL